MDAPLGQSVPHAVQCEAAGADGGPEGEVERPGAQPLLELLVDIHRQDPLSGQVTSPAGLHVHIRVDAFTSARHRH